MTIVVPCSGCQAPLRIRDEYAGRPMRCPTCGAVVQVDADEPVLAIEADAPATVRPMPAARSKACPRCRQRSPLRAVACRFCGASFDEAPTEMDEPGEGSPQAPEYVPCPHCGASGAERVRWTFWGSFYGPALLSHVRCPECDYRYNGKTGGSNAGWAFLFVFVPAVLLAGILVGVVLLIINWMQS